MKNRKFQIVGALLLAGVSSAALANDSVVMRRPLPYTQSGNGGSSTGGGDSGSNPTNTGVAYGWQVDCQANSITCMKEPAGSDEFNPVANSECPASQSVAANNQAHSWGLFGMGEGVDTTNWQDLCTGGADPMGTKSYYVAFSWCNGSNRVIDCYRDFVADPYVFASRSNAGVLQSDSTACKAQAETFAWQQYVTEAYNGGVIKPSNIAAEESRGCNAEVTGSVYGAECFEGTVSCYKFDYVNDNGNITVVSEYQNAQESECTSSSNYSAGELAILRRYGLLAPNANVTTMCQAPTFFGAIGACGTRTTYDAGWPDVGQANVESGFYADCFEVYNGGDPSGASMVITDLSNCQGQTLNQAQRDQLAALSPALYDWSTFDTNCPLVPEIDLNFQHGGGGRWTDVNPGATALGSTLVDQFLDYESIDYVCTDAAPGTYFNGTLSTLKSTYPITRSPCDAQLVSYMAKLENDNSAARAAAIKTCTDLGVSTSLCGLTIDNIQDQSRIEITTRTVAIGEAQKWFNKSDELFVSSNDTGVYANPAPGNNWRVTRTVTEWKYACTSTPYVQSNGGYAPEEWAGFNGPFSPPTSPDCNGAYTTLVNFVTDEANMRQTWCVDGTEEWGGALNPGECQINVVDNPSAGTIRIEQDLWVSIAG